MLEISSDSITCSRLNAASDYQLTRAQIRANSSEKVLRGPLVWRITWRMATVSPQSCALARASADVIVER